jgi:glycosyltransferase involved in cell wall biosynthesis
MPEASVLLPVYNAQKTVSRSLKSLLRQNYPDFEICIINDGSTDNTLEVLSRFSDSRIKIYDLPENLGLVGALNAGIEKIDARYILRLDADDVCHEDRVGKQVRFMEEHDEVSLSGTWCHLIDRNQQKLLQKVPTGNDDLKARLYFNNPFVHPSMIFKRDVFEKCRYNKEYIHCEDYGLWVELSMDKDITFANIPEALVYKFENKGENISHRFYNEQLRSCSILRRKLLQHLGVEFSAADMSLHDAISINAFPDQDIEIVLHRVEEWLLRLQQANRSSRRVAPGSFDFELAQRLIPVYKHALNMGVCSADNLRSSRLISSLEPQQVRLVDGWLGIV